MSLLVANSQTEHGHELGSATAYRFGFNGKETSDEVAAEHYDFGARVYSEPLGRHDD